MATFMQFARVMPAGFLLLALPVAAQLKLGETSNTANGTISSGYNATYGNMIQSTHGWTVGGVGTFAGSYHSPNFLSYNINPYLNQSRANSNFQSISDASGVNASATIFGGSPFPGSISYSKAYNSEGNYGIPGLTNYVTHGNNDVLGVNWSEIVGGLPTFSAGFQTGSSNYSVYGTNDQGKNSFHTLNLQSAYRWAGFQTSGYYVNGGSHAEIPQIVAGEITGTHTSTDAFGASVSHLLPWRGSASTAFNRSNWNSDYLGYSSTGTIDTLNCLASVHPKNNVSLTGTVNYSDNLDGQLIQSIITSGGVVPASSSSDQSHSLDMMGTLAYVPINQLQTTAFVERRSQYYLDQTYGLTSYGGGASYSRHLLGGAFNGGFTLSANKGDQGQQDTLGFSTNANYNSEVKGWHITGGFGYAQNMQTLLITYLNSNYYYSASVHKRFGEFSFGGGAGQARTAITDHAGTENRSESYNATAGYGAWVIATGSYAKSSGQALATGAGLVPIPIPPPVLPPGLISLYGGDSYSFSLASSPVRRLTISAAYSRALSNTTNPTGTDLISSSNHTSQLNSIVQYQFRKMYFTSGYDRLEQGFSVSGNKPEIIASYYMGISRWFNFF